MSILSTAESRLPIVTAAAIRSFAEGGYRGTTIADVAQEAGISPAYVSKLFASKEQLFVAALDACFEEILAALARGADDAASDDPEVILDAMGLSYAKLLAERDLLMLQVHAQSVATVPEIAYALRSGLRRVTELALARSGAPSESVQRFVAYGQLCHLIVTAHLDDIDEAWAMVLRQGFRHF